MYVKINLRKTYDSIKWSFLEKMITGLGFPWLFVEWVMKCIKTVSFSILVNGKPMAPFQACKGLRQGDPMSPYLYAIAMEFLSRLLRALDNDISSFKLIKDHIDKFLNTSVLSTNCDKSDAYVIGVSEEVALNIRELLGMLVCSLPFRYLGCHFLIRN